VLTFSELVLLVEALGAEAKDSSTEIHQSLSAIPERATLRRATSGARNLVPPIGNRLTWNTRLWVDVKHERFASDVGQLDRLVSC